MAPSDETLLTQYKQGDPRAFRALVQRYTTPIYNLALRLLEDSMEAENITQETFLRVVTSINRVRLDMPFKPYIFKIAVNLCRDQGRKKRPLLFVDLDQSIPTETSAPLVSETIPDDAPLLWERLEKEELHSRLQNAIDGLPAAYRAAVILRYVEELSYEEMAQALNLPVNTIRTHLRRAKELLRRELDTDARQATQDRDVAPLRIADKWAPSAN